MIKTNYAYENNGVFSKAEECTACHYVYEWDYDKKEVIKGDEKFIDVSLTATYYDEKQWRPEMKELSVHMCPKCGTLAGVK